MCAQFMIRTKRRNLARQMGLIIREDDDSILEGRFLPYQKAPVVLEAEGKRELREMQFSLVPSWSKERRAKFATHNARLFTYDEKTKKTVPIYEKPTWRGPFAHRHCLVPINDFFEPIYRGEWAGNMVRFHPKEDRLMVAAGIWEEWTSRETGEIIDSFSIITHDPHPFVEEVGHDRTPVFLKPEAFGQWLKPEAMSPKEYVELLQEAREVPELTVDIDRPLKSGWEKRRTS